MFSLSDVEIFERDVPINAIVARNLIATKAHIGMTQKQLADEMGLRLKIDFETQ